jgi:hypothetical protein
MLMIWVSKALEGLQAKLLARSFNASPSGKNVAFPVIATHFSRGLQRTHDNRTPYIVDGTGGGDSSAFARSDIFQNAAVSDGFMTGNFFGLAGTPMP